VAHPAVGSGPTGSAAADTRGGGWSLADTLDRVASLPPALVGPEQTEDLRTIAAWLPASLSNWLYLECRLAGGQSQIDLAAYVDRRGRDLLARPRTGEALERLIAAHREWAVAAAIAEKWTDPVWPVHGAVEGIWLEFDVPRPGWTARRTLVAPSVLIDFSESRVERLSTAERVRVVEDAIAPLTAGHVAASASPIRRCVEALPPHAYVIYAGAMLPRRTGVARLCVIGLARHELATYLRTVHWPGPIDDIAQLCGAIARAEAAASAPTIVHLDVGADLRPTLGLEYALARGSQLRGEIAEVALLDWLVAEGLCDRAKRDALSAWPGYELGVMPHELWPSLIVRRVNHVKLVWTPDAPLQTKAYLGVKHEPFRHRARQRVGADAGPGARSVGSIR
jgi:hypothetical protein